MDLNPYLSPAPPPEHPLEPRQPWKRFFGIAFGVTSVAIGCLPILSAISIGGQLCWLAMTASPAGPTLRPMAFPLLIVMTACIGLVFCLPLALLCGYASKALGCSGISDAQKIAGAMFIMPLVIGFLSFVGFMMITSYRGVPTD